MAACTFTGPDFMSPLLAVVAGFAACAIGGFVGVAWVIVRLSEEDE